MALQNSTPSIAAGVDDAVRRQATQFTLVDDKWLIDIVRAYMASRNPPLQYFPNPFRGDWSELIKLRVEPNGYSWESNVKKIAERFRTLRHNYVCTLLLHTHIYIQFSFFLLKDLTPNPHIG